MIRIILLTVLLTLNSLVFGQSFREDMKKVRESYANNYISMSLTYRMYNKETDLKPIEIQTLWLESFGRKLHYKGQGMEVIYNEKNMLMVSESDKEITLDTVMENFNRPDYELLPIDTAVSKMKEITSTMQGSNIIKYTLTPKDASETSKIIYHINKETWIIEKIELFSGSTMGGGKVTITYTQILKKSSPPISSFDMGIFITPNKNGGYKLTEKFKDFKFFHRNDYKKISK